MDKEVVLIAEPAVRRFDENQLDPGGANGSPGV
jgi:hypothetical protein